MTLEQMREAAERPMDWCGECGGSIKTYKSPLGVTTRVLIYMNNNSKPGEWVHIPTIPNGWIAKGGDYAKLRYWSLIEAHPATPAPNKRSSGLWRLTGFGRMFAKGHTGAWSHCYWKHPGTVVGFEPHLVRIQNALGKRFDYEELMTGRLPERLLTTE